MTNLMDFEVTAMAFFAGNIRSSVLEMDTQLHVMLPQDYIKNKPPAKTVILLHGIRQNASSWARMTNVERYAARYGYALLMPEVQRSFYTDMRYGMNYFTYITEELPEIATSMFGLPTDRDSLYIAGLSMGGYGALKCALSLPEKFSACASFSGALDLKRLFHLQRNSTVNRNELEAIFDMSGELPPEADLFHLADTCAKREEALRPNVFVCCGTEDYLLPSSRSFHEHMRNLPFKSRYMEWGGTHDWTFWDKAVQEAFEFFSGPAQKEEQF